MLSNSVSSGLPRPAYKVGFGCRGIVVKFKVFLASQKGWTEHQGDLDRVMA